MNKSNFIQSGLMKSRYIATFCLYSLIISPSFADQTQAPSLKFDVLNQTTTLPNPLPDDWMIVHDAAFLHFLEGRFIILDPLDNHPKTRYKGAIPASNIAQFAHAAKRKEFYVTEIFYSRGVRGDRTDVISIYDQQTLKFKSEIELPKPKRAHSMPEIYNSQLIDQDKFLLTFNVSPATSVFVTDLDKKQVVSEISIPGCALMYPTGQRGFSALCSNGGLMTVLLDEQGKEISKKRLPSFFDTNKDPLFEKPAIHEGIAYFPSFSGDIQAIDFTKNEPKIGARWSMLTEDEKKSGWRPGGWQLHTLDKQGLLYIIMHPKGGNGTHKSGGTEIWVYDLIKKQKIRTIVLKNESVSVTYLPGKSGLLAVTNAEMNIDVYQAGTGEFLNNQSNFGQETPFLVHPIKQAP